MERRRRDLGAACCATIALIAVSVGGATAGPAAGADGAPLHWTSARAQHIEQFDPLAALGSAGAAGSTGSDPHFPSQVDPGSTATAIVELSADSVGDAKEKADAGGAPFDEGRAERNVEDAQSAEASAVRGLSLKIVGRTTHVMNALIVEGTVRSIRAVADLAGVASVRATNRIALENTNSNRATGVTDAWTDLGVTGKGVTIGLLDSGIDYFHADFGGDGNPASFTADDGTVIEPGTFPTAKVVGGYDFVGDSFPRTDPKPDPDPKDCTAPGSGGHGTHTAGTAAGMGVLADGTTYHGPYDNEALAAHQWKVGPGAAPEATIRDYRIFSCSGVTDDSIILQAIDRAVADRVDVMSMSFGSPFGGPDDVIIRAVDRATTLGVLTVAAAGNDGPLSYVVSSPSSANTALSVAAADFSRNNPVFPSGVQVTGDITMSIGNFNDWSYEAGVTGQLVNVGDLCVAANWANTAGKIVVGTFDPFGKHPAPSNPTLSVPNCDLDVYFSAAGARGKPGTSGAAAVVQINDELAGASGFGFLGSEPIIDISSGRARSFTDGLTVNLDAGPNPDLGNIAFFSSTGVRSDTVPKPDVTAPGFFVRSAAFGSGTEGVDMSGTSMATPHVSGVAALAKQLHPAWGPRQLKAAIMSTADPDKLKNFDPLLGGSGLISAPRALTTDAYLTTRDGLDNLGFGFQEMAGPFRGSRTITINNTGDVPITYDLAAGITPITDVKGLAVSVSPGSVAVAAHGRAVAKVTVSLTDPEHIRSAIQAHRYGLANDFFGDSLNPDGFEPWITRGTFVATPTNPRFATLRATIALAPSGLSDIHVLPTGEAPVSSITIVNSGVHSAHVDVLDALAADQVGESKDRSVPDIRDVGVAVEDVEVFDPLGNQVSAPVLQFTVATANRLTTQWLDEYDIALDLDANGSADVTIRSFRGFVEADDASGKILWFDTSDWTLNDSNVIMSLPVPVVESLRTELGITSSAARATVTTFSGTTTGTDTVTTTLFDPLHLGVTTTLHLSVSAGAAVVVPAASDYSSTASRAALGWLVVSRDDAAGPKSVDRVRLSKPDH
jgi:subtilisin family serine protease